MIPNGIIERARELDRVVEECNQPDWDGYGADPASPIAAQYAKVFLFEFYPDKWELPEIAVDPDGSISFDWMPSKHRSFSMSFSAEGSIVYAWMLGDERGSGIKRKWLDLTKTGGAF